MSVWLPIVPYLFQSILFVRIPCIQPLSPAVRVDLMIRRAARLLQAASTPIAPLTARLPSSLPIVVSLSRELAKLGLGRAGNPNPRPRCATAINWCLHQSPFVYPNTYTIYRIHIHIRLSSERQF